jgi:hypothetical protein
MEKSKIILIITVVIIIAVTAYFFTNNSDKENFSYHFGFPSWGGLDNRLYGSKIYEKNYERGFDYNYDPYVRGYPGNFMTVPVVTPIITPMITPVNVPVPYTNPFGYNSYNSFGPYDQRFNRGYINFDRNYNFGYNSYENYNNDDNYYENSIIPYINSSDKRCHKLSHKHEKCNPGFNHKVRIGEKKSYEWQCCK